MPESKFQYMKSIYIKFMLIYNKICTRVLSRIKKVYI